MPLALRLSEGLGTSGCMVAGVAFNVLPKVFFSHFVVPGIVRAWVQVIYRSSAEEDKAAAKVSADWPSRLGQRGVVVFIVVPVVIGDICSGS